MNKRLAAIAAFLVLPVQAWAGVDWAVWSGYPAATRTGTLPGGATITMTPAALSGTGSVPAGLGFTCDPNAPGMADSDNPPYQQIISGPPSTLLSPGDLVVDIDLSGLPADSRLLFGIADQKFALQLKLLDSSDDELPLDGIDVTPYHNYYPAAPPTFPNTWVADQNSMLIAGTLYRDATNDAVPSDFYNQTGLTILSGLPQETRTIRLLGTQYAEAEGLSLFVGVETAGTVEVTDNSGAAGDHAIAFGTVTVGATSITRKVTVTNPGGSAVTLEVTPDGLDEADFDLTNGCGDTLAGAASCDLTIAFHPSAAVGYAGSIGVVADGGDPILVNVSGTGTLTRTGDTNGDGSTTAVDALLALKIAVGTATATESILASCDMNGNGTISANDALAILRKSVGL